jgi:serine/threonine protein kinase
VYLGKWHNSEVAIKCLNPSLFYSGGEGAASRAAIADLLREATLLSSLRHPNVVWVYGVVLPKMKVWHGIAQQFSRAITWAGSLSAYVGSCSSELCQRLHCCLVMQLNRYCTC